MCIYLMNIFGDREIDIPPHSGQARSKIFRSPCQFLNGLFLRPPPPMLQRRIGRNSFFFQDCAANLGGGRRDNYPDMKIWGMFLNNFDRGGSLHIYMHMRMAQAGSVDQYIAPADGPLARDFDGSQYQTP